MRSRKKRLFANSVVMSVVILLFLFSNGQASLTPVFINEIHYDNAGTDENEGIEIVGVAGTDLTNWSILLYNGSGTTEGKIYGTIDLAGTIPNEKDGYGALGFYYAGMQNGSPDGIALADASDSLVQFLSYEGSFIADEGPAMGEMSTDIGVEESSSTGVDFSLQLTGAGLAYSEFNWSGPIAQTFGSINTDQSFVASNVPIPGAVWLLGTGLIGLVGIKRKRT